MRRFSEPGCVEGGMPEDILIVSVGATTGLDFNWLSGMVELLLWNRIHQKASKEAE